MLCKKVYYNIQPMQYELLEKQYTYKEQNPQYKGEELDPELAQGPIEHRKFRDCLCLLLYAVMWTAMIVIASYAWSNGNPHLLAAPFDSTGLQCGYGQYQAYPYAYYNNRNFSQFGCVQKCPESSQQTFVTMLGGQSYQNSHFHAYQTVQLVSLCFPVSQSISQYITTGLNYFDKVINDLKATWKISIISLFSALALSIVLLAFIRTCASCIVFIIILLYFGGLIGLGVGCMVVANNGLQGYEEWTNPEILRVAAYICWSIAGISMLVLCCNLQNIRVATAVIKATAEFTRQECKVIIVPFLMFLSITVFFVFWIYASVYIFSCGKVRPCRGSPYACIEWDVGVKRSLGLFLFGLFWNCEVAIAVCQFIIASTAAYWYFSHLGNSRFPLIKSFCRALTYQLGSLIFGALILCILWILQLLFQALHHSAKNQTISANPVQNACADYCIRCARCCLACFERFIRFVTKNAFLMMAISGEGFCTSAHQAFYLALRSSGTYAITHGVGHTLMLFGKLLIAVLVTILAYSLTIGLDEFQDAVYSPLTPAMSFVISYVVGTFFMDVFGVASDTVLLCYCLELDILKGLSYACPPGLKEVLDFQRK